MKADTSHIVRRADGRKAINKRLSAVFGWFEAAPLPEHLASLIDQLDAEPQPRAAETRAYSRA
jgi:hypothetical protein